MKRPSQRALVPAVLALLVIALTATAVPGTFSVDDGHYITTLAGLRQGSVHVPFTEGLIPSSELLAYDPNPPQLVTSSPVSVTAPPLYAFLAYPFAPFGARGLIALQTLSFAFAAWFVFRFVLRETKRSDVAWLAMATFIASSYSLEYAQGIWPHMLSVALAMSAVTFVNLLRASELRRHYLLGGLAGLSLGLATGLRYQNAVLLIAAALVVVWLSRRALITFALGCALPLLASSAINAQRLGSWNPISKGTGYIALPDTGASHRVHDGVMSTWARMVDYTAWPSSVPELGIEKNPETGASLVLGAVKKGVLQSSPWALIPLLAIGAAWLRRRRDELADATTGLRGLGFVIACVVGAFAMYGFRQDGWSFNQRYLLELMPLLSCGLGLALVRWTARWRAVAIGAALALAGCILLVGMAPESSARQLLLLKVPLALAGGLAVSWLLSPGRTTAQVAFASLLGAALAWALVVHVGDDLLTARGVRERNHQVLDGARDALPADRPIAIFAFWGAKDPYAPLLLERDLVVVDPHNDNGRDARALLDQFARLGRTCFVDRAMPPELIRPLLNGRRVRAVAAAPWLIEIAPP